MSVSRTIKAIETTYAGCRFRSRLEARWAVFFDALGITWNYEPEGFETQAGRYLPDFYLPTLGTWVEIKGQLDRQTLNKLIAHVDFGGLPGTSDAAGTTRGLLILGEIPRTSEFQPAVVHTLLQHHKGVRLTLAYFNGCYLVPLDHAPDAGFKVDGGFGDDLWAFVKKVHEGGFTMASAETSAFNAARSARFEFGQSGGMPTVRGDA